MTRVLTQINWQHQLGGGEIYTRFFTRAAQDLGWEVEIVVARQARFWNELGLDNVRFIPIDHGRDIPEVLARRAGTVVSHMTLPVDVAKFIAERHRLASFLHMPLEGRKLGGLVHCHSLFPVSNYVRDVARRRGLQQVLDMPLYGVADLAPRSPALHAIVRRSEYDWDRRKVRDRLLSWCEPLRNFRSPVEFHRRPGLTLGIVSRLTPIKQFPLMFSCLASVLAAEPGVNLEIFGSGGYASVRDLRRALAPMSGRVRFWGHQSDPATVYRGLDYVLAGLPEREALGLNLIEAQAAGTPVIAVNAPPFTETVVHGASGFLYADPRSDGGASFRALLGSLRGDAQRPDPRRNSDHLKKFLPDAFKERVAAALSVLAA